LEVGFQPVEVPELLLPGLAVKGEKELSFRRDGDLRMAVQGLLHHRCSGPRTAHDEKLLHANTHPAIAGSFTMVIAGLSNSTLPFVKS
jgi:hypothetical protein